jgi:hypothetical protein
LGTEFLLWWKLARWPDGIELKGKISVYV